MRTSRKMWRVHLCCHSVPPYISLSLIIVSCPRVRLNAPGLHKLANIGLREQLSMEPRRPLHVAVARPLHVNQRVERCAIPDQQQHAYPGTTASTPFWIHRYLHPPPTSASQRVRCSLLHPPVALHRPGQQSRSSCSPYYKQSSATRTPSAPCRSS